MLPPYKIFLDDKLDHDGAPIESPDPADIADADAFEELEQNDTSFVTTNTNQPAIDKSPHTPEGPEQLPNDMEVGSTGVMQTVVVDRFPSASAGAPIHDMPCGNPIYDSQRDADGDSTWSPFMSQCDWLFACWAKMRGPTSSAVTELLAIPEVRTSLCSIFTLLIWGPRL